MFWLIDVFWGDQPHFDRSRFSARQPQIFRQPQMLGKPQRIEQQENEVGHELCHYCQQEGHWKKECPVLNKRGMTERVKSAGLVAPVFTSGSCHVASFRRTWRCL